jgi:hypothetical protein
MHTKTEPATHFVNEDGHVVVWSIHSPTVPEYGDWAFAEISWSKNNLSPQVTFVRQLTNFEVNSIRRQYMVWGSKLPGVPWALARGRPSTFGAGGRYDITDSSAPNRSVVV